jgi:hypothetical protein
VFANVTFLKDGCYEGICSLDLLQSMLGLIIIGDTCGFAQHVVGCIVGIL